MKWNYLGVAAASIGAMAGSAYAQEFPIDFSQQNRDLRGIEVNISAPYSQSSVSPYSPFGDSVRGLDLDGGFSSVNVGDIYGTQAQGPHPTPLPSAGALGLAGLLAAGSRRRR